MAQAAFAARSGRSALSRAVDAAESACSVSALKHILKATRAAIRRALGLKKPMKAWEKQVEIHDTGTLALASRSHDAVAIILPTKDVAKARETARMLVRRAGMPARAIVIEDRHDWGFARIVNAAAAGLRCDSIVFATDDAYPGINWLHLTHEALMRSGKSLISFNDGVWNGAIPVFGMARKEWIDNTCGGKILHESYVGKWAQVELVLLACAQEQFAREPVGTFVSLEAIRDPLALYDSEADRDVFKQRASSGFDIGVYPRASDLGSVLQSIAQLGTGKRATTRLVTTQELHGLAYHNPAGIAVVLPCIDAAKGMATAELLAERAGTDASIFVVVDIEKQGFIKTLNDAAAGLDVGYVVYAAEDAVPGRDWLKTARDELEQSGRGLLAFNCGKWHGYIAAFGMVRMDWVRTLYGGPILYPGYRAHRADNELTWIARVTGQHAYNPKAVLVEYDPTKMFSRTELEASNYSHADTVLYDMRFENGFDGRVDGSELKARLRQWENSRRKMWR